ncbi:MULTISPECIES: hypothetical protein [Mesorhizobium]|uniref:hypothetical protein n=1 Tax=Mesorhizobium sp. TaxID=1871066 RepID=UPI000494914E|nr:MULTISPECIES: hypothetical protein [Mesorhizobium]RWI08815.1 MAG: hypothetical protein EOQ90_17265 [Mesorhizobium sp.]RWM66485.1 MAG: hypothetical protein EOR82_29410 [Mesorhizobium sp.]RWM85741.1 MAG: hypothetical protein EOR83_10780 [Mesorhizobium sp.]TIO21414.1 MAG: hypothetical protein E5X83_29850 [Mesorhizobium sp.]TJV54972.1 MAG: hypothetical protein E5X82_29435 [Mesorhizobium sp.]
MTITIRVEGAQPEEIVRGLLAAQEVFDKAGVTPDQAAMARFVVEGWDIRGFTGKVPEEELAICTVWDEADQAAVQACCSGWDADKVPSSGDLELVQEPQRFSFTSEEERSEWLFQTADAGILEEICEEGYFSDGRPEDEVAFLLADWDFEQLTYEQRGLYDERIYPLMRIWFFERERFEGEYARRRDEWARDLPHDSRQLSLFAA